MVFQPLIFWRFNPTVESVGKDLISIKLDMMLDYRERVKRDAMIKSGPKLAPHSMAAHRW